MSPGNELEEIKSNMKLGVDSLSQMVDKFVNVIQTHSNDNFCGIFNLPKEFECHKEEFISFFRQLEKENIPYKMMFSNNNGIFFVFGLIYRGEIYCNVCM